MPWWRPNPNRCATIAKSRPSTEASQNRPCPRPDSAPLYQRHPEPGTVTIFARYRPAVSASSSAHAFAASRTSAGGWLTVSRPQAHEPPRLGHLQLAQLRGLLDGDSFGQDQAQRRPDAVFCGGHGRFGPRVILWRTTSTPF